MWSRTGDSCADLCVGVWTTSRHMVTWGEVAKPPGRTEQAGIVHRHTHRQTQTSRHNFEKFHRVGAEGAQSRSWGAWVQDKYLLLTSLVSFAYSMSSWFSHLEWKGYISQVLICWVYLIIILPFCWQVSLIPGSPEGGTGGGFESCIGDTGCWGLGWGLGLGLPADCLGTFRQPPHGVPTLSTWQRLVIKTGEQTSVNRLRTWPWRLQMKDAKTLGSVPTAAILGTHLRGSYANQVPRADVVSVGAQSTGRSSRR